MTFSGYKIASLDLGNSTCRMGLYDNGQITQEELVGTQAFIADPTSLTGQYATLPSTIAYCSVSPRAEAALKDWARA